MRFCSTLGSRRRATVLMSATSLLVVSQLLVACGGSGSSASGGGAGGTGVLTVGTQVLGGDTVGPVAFDPTNFTVADGNMTYDVPIYSGLLRETPSGAYVPELASSVTVPNPSTIDIQVRRGVVFSDGEPFTAAAVKAGLERNMATTHKGAFNPSLFDISSIDVTGPDSLVLNFSHQAADLFYPHLADEESFIVAPKAISSGTANSSPVGAGPFMLESYAPGQRVVLVKNPRYWDAKDIHLSGITFVQVAAGPQQVNAIEAGQVNAVAGLPTSDLSTLDADKSLQVTSAFIDGGFSFAPMCKASGPLANVDVRQALNYAVDRNAINTAVYLGKGEPAWTLFPSGNALYDSRLTGYYAYNPAKARALLADAGYPHGFSISIMPLPEPLTDQIATILQAEWKQIGVNLQIVSTANYVQDFYVLHEAQMSLNPDSATGLLKITNPYVPGSIGDVCNYSNPTLAQLASEAGQLPPGSPQLKTIWDQMQEFVIHNALGIYLDFDPYLVASTKAVTDLQLVPYLGGLLDYWSASVS